ncbi:unnamed protein product [Prunus armeniaca]
MVLGPSFPQFWKLEGLPTVSRELNGVGFLEVSTKRLTQRLVLASEPWLKFAGLKGHHRLFRECWKRMVFQDHQTNVLIYILY